MPATITDLGTLGGTSSTAAAINSLGDVVGDSFLASGVQHAYLYSGGKMTDLGTLGGAFGSSAAGLNDSGQVVGVASNAAGDFHAFRFKPGGMVDLGTLGKGTGLGSGASSINASGQIVGYSDTGGTEYAFLYSPATDTMKNLGALGGNSSRGYGINASGQIVGDADVTVFIAPSTFPTAHAFSYSGGVMKDLGTLGGANSSAVAINNAGQIVGYSDLVGSTVSNSLTHAFLYSAGVMKDLGALNGGSSSAIGVNSNGQVVGSSVLGNVSTAFLYSGGTMIDLSTLLPANSGWQLEVATGINDAGQIVGYGMIKGQRHAFLMNGISTPQGQSQTITFNAISSTALSAGALTLSATATSGLPVTFASTTPTVCTVSGTTATLVAAGTCTITANQAGNATYQPAPQVNQSFTVTSGTSSQTITFATLPDVTFGVAPFTVSATASSGLPVTFSAIPASVCTINVATVTITGAGICSITASQSGNAPLASFRDRPSLSAGRKATFTGATPVSQSFIVKAAAGAPAINAAGVVPVYSSSTTIQAGSWISIYGTNLAAALATWNSDFPTSLGGVTVTIDGKKAYLWYVSPAQINLQAPDTTSTGDVPVVVTNSKGSWTSIVTLGQIAPSFSLLDVAKHVTGIILRNDKSGAYGGGTYDILGPTGTSLGYKTVAAKPGDSVVLFGVGFGPTTPAVPAGQAYSGAAATTNKVQLTINNTAITPDFSGLSSAGLYQFNLTMPAGLGTGDISILAKVAGLQTQTGVVISLQ